MARRLYRLVYTLSERADRELLPFQMRDGEAALHLVDALVDHGYRFETSLNQYPSRDSSRDPQLSPSDMSAFRADDLILLSMRPPMDDRYIGPKKSIHRSFTTLEDALFSGTLRHVFECCARSEIRLTPLIARICEEIAARKTMLFYQHGGAGYQEYGSPPTHGWKRFKQGDCLTAAFLVYVEHAWPDGPAFMAAFGLGGTETLVWCRLLKTRFANLLCTTSFAMVEMRSEIPKRPQTLDFADSWDVRLLGSAPLSLLRDRGNSRAA